jgi:iron-sulfur cluster repair protein YtfE (RIC family)
MKAFIPFVLVMVGVTTLAAAQHADIPSSLKADHEKLHTDLSALTTLPGRTGEAAKHVAAVLHEHFVKEEQVAMPPLALLTPIALGRATPEMRSVVALTDRLQKEKPQMRREHEAIVKALTELGRAAEAEHHPDVSRFVEELTAHAQTEEQVLYPAAMLVGEYLKLKFPAGGPPDAARAR